MSLKIFRPHFSMAGRAFSPQVSIGWFLIMRHLLDVMARATDMKQLMVSGLRGRVVLKVAQKSLLRCLIDLFDACFLHGS